MNYDCPQFYRINVLYEIPKGGVCAEFGVHRGNWSKKIVEITKPKELWLIDHWECEDPRDDRFEKFLKQSIRMSKETKVIVKKGFFHNIDLPKNYFN